MKREPFIRVHKWMVEVWLTGKWGFSLSLEKLSWNAPYMIALEKYSGQIQWNLGWFTGMVWWDVK